eukprot:365442-Chlamydomonas_euryale.AAC.14
MPPCGDTASLRQQPDAMHASMRRNTSALNTSQLFASKSEKLIPPAAPSTGGGYVAPDAPPTCAGRTAVAPRTRRRDDARFARRIMRAANPLLPCTEDAATASGATAGARGAVGSYSRPLSRAMLPLPHPPVARAHSRLDTDEPTLNAPGEPTSNVVGLVCAPFEKADSWPGNTRAARRAPPHTDASSVACSNSKSRSWSSSDDPAREASLAAHPAGSLRCFGAGGDMAGAASSPSRPPTQPSSSDSSRDSSSASAVSRASSYRSLNEPLDSRPAGAHSPLPAGGAAAANALCVRRPTLSPSLSPPTSNASPSLPDSWPLSSSAPPSSSSSSICCISCAALASPHMRSSSLGSSSPPYIGRDMIDPISYSVMPASAQRCSSAVVSSSTRTHSGRSTGSSRASSSRSAAASRDLIYASSSSLNGSMACGQCSHSK